MKLKNSIAMSLLLIGFNCIAMDGMFQMPNKDVIYERLTNGSTCFYEHDVEATQLAAILANKKLLFRELESRVNGAVKRHVDYLALALADDDTDPKKALERCLPEWKKGVLVAVLQGYKALLQELENE